MRIFPVALVFAATVLPAAAQFCRPQNLTGAYGFQLSGTTDISGDTKPVASIGRLEFDGGGSLSGVSSVNFAGYFLGNPVTGSYEAHQDCAITWSLQDDSGALQHFAGTLTPDLERATFRQTDPGGAQNGTLVRLSPDCTQAALAGIFSFSIAGSVIPMNPGEAGHRVAYQGVIAADPGGNLSISSAPAGTADVDSDCIVDIAVMPAPAVGIKLRGVFVTGKEILAVETDPGAAVTARFRSR